MSVSTSTSRRRIDVTRSQLLTEVKTIPDPLLELKDLSSRVATLTRLVQQDLGQIITRAQALGIIVPSHVLELQSRQIQTRTIQRNLVFEDSGVQGFNVVGLDGEKKTRQNTNALLLPRRNLPRIIQDETLPVLHLVMVMLPASFTLCCRRVCKQFNATIKSEIHWRSRTSLTFRDLRFHDSVRDRRSRIFTDAYLPRMINVRSVELYHGVFEMTNLGRCVLLESLTLRNCFPHVILGEASEQDSPTYVDEPDLVYRYQGETGRSINWQKAMTNYVSKACPRITRLKRLRIEASHIPSFVLNGKLIVLQDGRNHIAIWFLGWISSILQLALTSLVSFEWQMELTEHEVYLDKRPENKHQNDFYINRYLYGPSNPVPVYQDANTQPPDHGLYRPEMWGEVRNLSIKELLDAVTLPSTLRNLVLNQGYDQYQRYAEIWPDLTKIGIQCPNLESLSVYQVEVYYQDFKTCLTNLPRLKTFNTNLSFSGNDILEFGPFAFNETNPRLENLSWMYPPFFMHAGIQDVLNHTHLQRLIVSSMYGAEPTLKKLEIRPPLVEFRVRGAAADVLTRVILPRLDTKHLQVLECFDKEERFGQFVKTILAQPRYPELTRMIMKGHGSFSFGHVNVGTFPKLTHYYHEALNKDYGTEDILKWSVDALGPILHYIKMLPTLQYATLDLTHRVGREQENFNLAARPLPLPVLNDMAKWFKQNSTLLEFALVYYTHGRWPLWIQLVRYSTTMDFEIRHHAKGIVPQIWPFQHTSYTDPSCETLLHTIDETKTPAQLEYDQDAPDKDNDNDDDQVLEIKQGASRSGNTRARMVHDVGHVPVALGHITIPGDAMVYNGDTVENIHVLPNEVFIIRLTSNPTTGYNWRRPRKSKKYPKLPLVTSGLTYLDKEYYTIYHGKRPIPPGTGGYDYWAFQADNVKVSTSCRVYLEYSREWEPDALEERVFNVIISPTKAFNETRIKTSPRSPALPTIRTGKVLSVKHTDRHWIVTLVDKNGLEDRIPDYRIAAIHELSRPMEKSKSTIQGKDIPIIEISESERGEIGGALFQNSQVSHDLQQLKPGDQVAIVEQDFENMDKHTTIKTVSGILPEQGQAQERTVNAVNSLSHAGRKSNGTSRSRAGHTSASRDKVGYVMHEFKHHELHSGSHNGSIVTNPKQAIAIALSYKRRGH